MTYKLAQHEDFADEWKKLDSSIREQLKKKIAKVLKNPHIPKNRLRGDLSSCYKIKLRSAGVRLIYQVNDNEVIVLLVAVGARSDGEAYDTAKDRV